MSPIDKIKEGILGNDMEEIIKGFELLTGEKLEPKEKEKGKESEEAATASPAWRKGDGALEGDTTEEEKGQASQKQNPLPTLRSKDLDFSTEPREADGKYGKSEPIVVGENQFIDDGTEATDITTPDVGRTTRRPPVKMVEVKCHACGEKEMINAQYKSGEFHRCGKCVGV